MTTQSKSVLLPFLIVAGLLFAAALGWKFFSSEGETPKTTTEAVIEQSTQADTAVVETTAETSNPVMAQPDPKPYLENIPTDKGEARAQASNHMKMAMRYQTAEKALEALNNFHEQGNEAMVKTLIEFMSRTYPNTAIPSEILD